MSVTAPYIDLRDPAGAAARVGAVNDRLAASASVSEDLATQVGAIAAALGETPIERWIAADPYLALLVHRAALEATTAVAAGSRDELRLALERLAHALAALAEAEETGEARAPKELARWLAESIDAPQRELAALLGVDLRRFQRWISERERAAPEGEHARRVRAVARLAAQLRHAFTGAGVIAWFDWPREDLGGRAPRELLDDPVRLPDLALAAGSARGTTFA